MSVFCRPAADAVHVAGRGGVEKDRPWDVAVILLPHLSLDGTADEVGIYEEVHHDCPEHLRIYLTEQLQNETVIGIVLVLDDLADPSPLRGVCILGEFVRPVHKLQQILFRVLVEVPERAGQAEFFDRCRSVHHLSLPVVFPVYCLVKG